MFNGIRTTVTPKSSCVRLREREEGMEGEKGKGRKKILKVGWVNMTKLYCTEFSKN